MSKSDATKSGAKQSKSASANDVVRGSKAPARPLPRLDRSKEDAARARIREAKSDYNRAIAANKKSPPDKELFFRALNACKKKLDEADAILEPVTMWEEESTMEDWKVRGEEDAYLRTIVPILAKLDKLRAAAEKISRAR